MGLRPSGLSSPSPNRKLDLEQGREGYASGVNAPGVFHAADKLDATHQGPDASANDREKGEFLLIQAGFCLHSS